MGIVEPTEIQVLDRCERWWWIEYGQNLVPRTFATKLIAGTAGHEALAGYYRSGRKEDPVEHLHAWYDRFLREEAAQYPDSDPASGDLLSELGKVERVLALYPEQDALDLYGTWKVREVEVRFEVQVSEQVVLSGRLDTVLEDPRGGVVIMDHKFYSRFPSVRETMLDKQGLLYMYAAHALFGYELRGIVYDLVRKTDAKNPSAPLVERRYVPFGDAVASYAQAEVLSAVRRREQVRNTPLLHTRSSVGEHCRWCPYYEPCSMLRRLAEGEALAYLQAAYQPRPALQPGLAVRS